MPESHLTLEQSTRLVSQIIDSLERLKEDFLLLNIEEVLAERPDLSAMMLLNLNQIKYYLDTNPIIFLSACELALKEKSD